MSKKDFTKRVMRESLAEGESSSFELDKGEYSSSGLDKGEYSLYFDGASRGNPGLAGAGVVLISSSNKEIKEEKSVFLGDKITNNQAEYYALIEGLILAISKSIKKLKVYGDSLLVINQLRGEWVCRSPNLIPLFSSAIELLKDFDEIVFIHIPRNQNTLADACANRAIDER